MRLIIFLFFLSNAFAQLNENVRIDDYRPQAKPKEKVMILSWGDVVGDSRFQGVGQVDNPDNVRQAARNWKAHGVEKVIFRVDDWRILPWDRGQAALKQWRDATQKAWENGVLKTALEAAKAEGMQIQMWFCIYDEGCPAEVLYQDTIPFHYQSPFTQQHPEYNSCDRSLSESGRRYHWGVLELAYPEARRYLLEQMRRFSDAFAFDGVFLSVRTHTPPPDYADQFGFNQPIVDEYQRRYGKDILRQSFELDKWRDLRGEYLTQFLREAKAHLKTRGQKLSIGVAQGEHIGPPFGNMTIEWQKWVAENIVDELVVGHHTNQRATYPYRTQRAMGYIQDQDEAIGLPPIEQAVTERYAPLCLQYGVKLYVDIPLGQFYRTYNDCTLGFAGQEPDDLIRKLEQLPGLTGIVIDGRPLSLPKKQ